MTLESMKPLNILALEGPARRLCAMRGYYPEAQIEREGTVTTAWKIAAEELALHVQRQEALAAAGYDAPQSATAQRSGQVREENDPTYLKRKEALSELLRRILEGDL